MERGTVLVFLPGDYKLHMYFIVWTKQYSISKPKGCALPAHSVSGDDQRFDPGKGEKSL